MKARHKRLSILVAGVAVLSLATLFIFKALDNNLSYFFSPTEVTQGVAPVEHIFRLGGLVEVGSVQRGSDDLMVTFVVSDGPHQVKVNYSGILPDLFSEGQGVIAQGRLNDQGIFVAQEVLAKHDETYMPPEVAEALEKGHQAGEAQNYQNYQNHNAAGQSI
ncbi:cytochrome c maturation protein CcmE [Ectothiorhodospiraceae bacterium BW-2]|nr:cytochrome c maturation protein CcmE [Ectothiorhodospiraceae bacterium BW-2]